MRRLLTHMGWDHHNPERRWVAVSDLSSPELRLAYYGVLALLAIGLAAVCRRSAAETSASGWSREIALVVLATLWFSPVAWSYHPTAVAPALAVILSRKAQHPWLVWLTIGLWLLGMMMLGLHLGRAAGEMLWTTLLLGVLLLAVTERSQAASHVTPELACLLPT